MGVRNKPVDRNEENGHMWISIGKSLTVSAVFLSGFSLSPSHPSFAAPPVFPYHPDYLSLPPCRDK